MKRPLGGQATTPVKKARVETPAETSTPAVNASTVSEIAGSTTVAAVADAGRKRRPWEQQQQSTAPSVDAAATTSAAAPSAALPRQAASSHTTKPFGHAGRANTGPDSRHPDSSHGPSHPRGGSAAGAPATTTATTPAAAGAATTKQAPAQRKPPSASVVDGLDYRGLDEDADADLGGEDELEDAEEDDQSASGSDESDASDEDEAHEHDSELDGSDNHDGAQQARKNGKQHSNNNNNNALRVLPRWLAEPKMIQTGVTIDDIRDRLDPRVVRALTKMGIQSLFPVQASLLPEILGSASSAVHPGDLCVSSPTGSGKTMAFAIPIVNKLSTRVVPRLRALILQPTRELAAQVKSVFDSLAQFTPLTTALITGQLSLAAEQDLLAAGAPSRSVLADSVLALAGNRSSGSAQQATPIVLCDVVVATPGRLVDHLNCNPALLDHLEYLVLDEADRLLSQSYSDWLPRVLAGRTTRHQRAAAQSSNNASATLAGESGGVGSAGYGMVNNSSSHVRSSDPTSSTVATMFARIVRQQESVLPLMPQSIMRKLLFSATLTNNPEKIAALHLVFPRYFVAAPNATLSVKPVAGAGADAATAMDTTADGQEPLFDADGDNAARFTLPATLTQEMIVCQLADKPLALAQRLYGTLIRAAGKTLPADDEAAATTTPHRVVFASDDEEDADPSNEEASAKKRGTPLSRAIKALPQALVFTASVESTHRLALLLRNLLKQALPELRDIQLGSLVAEFSSSLSKDDRGKMLNRFRTNQVHVLICSDAMARGMDIENVAEVINYDVPVYFKTYVHRVGRTARAGRSGQALTLLRSEEVAAFKRMLGKAGHSLPAKIRGDSAAHFANVYQEALESLRAAIEKEKGGKSRNNAAASSNPEAIVQLIERPQLESAAVEI